MTIPPKRLENTRKAIDDFNVTNDMSISFSYLPVRHDSSYEIDKEIDVYLDLIKSIKKFGFDDNGMTIKMHQIGVYTSYDHMKRALIKILKKCDNKIFLWLDMECEETVDDTIRVYFELREMGFEKIGIAIQAYLHRSFNDVKQIIDSGGIVRPVKGFYNGCQFDTWSEVTENYYKIAKYIIDHSIRPIVATHDLDLLDRLKKHAKYKGIKPEFQFFRGVRDEVAKKLRSQGEKVRIYFPFGNFLKFTLTGWNTFDRKRTIERILGFKTIT